LVPDAVGLPVFPKTEGLFGRRDGFDLHCRSLAAAGEALGSLDAGRSILFVSLYDMYYND
jgi:hypothetical protein